MTIQKLILALCLLLLVPLANLYSQGDTLKVNNINHILQDHAKNGNYPERVIKIRNSEFPVDASILKKIDSTWIRKIEVHKNKKYKTIFDSPPQEAKIVIYIKREDFKSARQVLKK